MTKKELPVCENCGGSNIYFTKAEIVCRRCGHREERKND